MLKQACSRGTGKRAAAALTLENGVILENVLTFVNVRLALAHAGGTLARDLARAPMRTVFCPIPPYHPESVFSTQKHATTRGISSRCSWVH
jgi:hypothetical protein